MRIVIIESDAALAKFLLDGFVCEGYQVEVAQSATSEALLMDSDIIVVDTGDSVEKSAQWLRTLRQKRPAVALIALLKRITWAASVDLLDAGADDCVAKPFSFAELSARVRALHRRACSGGDVVLEVGDLKLDRVQRRVQRGGRAIELTSKEFSLLEYLMLNSGRQLTRAEILEQVWKIHPTSAATNVLDVYVAYLRKKIDAGGSEKLIHTSRGIGYEIRCSGRPQPQTQPHPVQTVTTAIGINQ